MMDGRRQVAGGRRTFPEQRGKARRVCQLPPSTSRLPARANGAGFTLIEVLVAVTLLGIIMVLAYQGLRTGAATAERGEAAIERVNRLRVTQEFIRSQLSRARPLPFEQDDTLGGIVFEGGPEALRFAGPMPGYLSFGGPYVQSLALVRGDDGLDLIFDHQVLTYGPEDQEPVEDEGRDPVTLITGLEDARFSYLVPPESIDDDPEWVDEWNQIDTLPLLVRLEGQFEEGSPLTWPLLTVAPRVDSGSRSGGGLEFGPGPVTPRRSGDRQ